MLPTTTCPVCRPMPILSGTLPAAPQAHDRVADELVEDAVVLEEDVHHQLEVVVHHLDHFLRGQLFRDAGESADVAEEDGELGEDAALGQLDAAARRLL